KCAHWQAIAVAASEQCGRTQVPHVAPVAALSAWLHGLGAAAAGEVDGRWLLSLAAEAGGLPQHWRAQRSLTMLSGPEGGLAADEQSLALQHGFVAVRLGPRVLRADTAPLAALAWLGLQALSAELPPRPEAAQT
ncbi:MAG: RsmE family RNA methyltransferase, partial [Rubrivivax sp.]